MNRIPRTPNTWSRWTCGVLLAALSMILAGTASCATGQTPDPNATSPDGDEPTGAPQPNDITDAGCEDVTSAADCDDGDPCSANDVCDVGRCSGTPVVGCVACGVSSDCDDADPCTDNVCTDAGICAHPANTAECDDGDPCSENDVCTDGTCGGTDVVGCVVCEDDADCDDGDGCTDDACGASNVCEHSFNEAVCDDGLPCTEGDTCVDGECNGVAVADCEGCTDDADCDDANPCTDDTCDDSGVCVHENNSSPCDDGSPCTDADVCADGECAGAPNSDCEGCVVDADCDDANPCTADACQGDECVFVANTASCDDGDACTTDDTCSAGVCAGAAVDCSGLDGTCTAGACDAATGQCEVTPITDGGACDDGDACTQSDVCIGGVCQGTAIDCDDGDVCTDDVCLPDGTCSHSPTQNPPMEQHSLTITVTGSGFVTLDPGGGVYDACTAVILNASPPECFDHWEGDLTGASNPIEIVMDSDKSVTAVFLDPPDDMTGTWTFDRTVTEVGSDGFCLHPAVGSQDMVDVAITQTGDEITLTMSFIEDADGNDLADGSPGQLWILFEPIECPVGEPYIVTMTGTISGDTVSLSVNGPDIGYCGCNWFTTATLNATLSGDECGTTSLAGTMDVELERICSQFGLDTCSISHSFSATRD
ncbi:MAG: hypothetical protein IIB61_02665 [Planctomycetes bacterium]|nr:hypothetical protein [Planctomycetota bacterium]